MNDCQECQRNQKRIRELEDLIRRMGESADRAFKAINESNVFEFPVETIRAKRLAVTAGRATVR